MAAMSSPVVLAADLPPLPATARMLIRVDCKRFGESALFQKDSTGWRSLLADPRKGLESLGVDPGKVEQIWIIAGDDFPSGTFVRVEGDVDTAKLETKWQQLVRERKFGATLQRVGERSCYSFDLPATVIAIPGLPATAYVGIAGPKTVIIGFDKETVCTQANLGNAPLVLDDPKSQVVGFLISPPTSFTSPQGILAGVKQISGHVHATDNLLIQMTATSADDANRQVFSESLRAGLEQIRRVFPPLAKQQNIDPRIIGVITKMVEIVQVESSAQKTQLKIELSGDEIRKALSKP